MIRRSPPLILLGTVLAIWMGSRVSFAVADTMLLSGALAPIPITMPVPVAPTARTFEYEPAFSGLNQAAAPVGLGVRFADHAYREPTTAWPSPRPDHSSKRPQRAAPDLPLPALASRAAQLRLLMLTFQTRSALAPTRAGFAPDRRATGMDTRLFPALRQRTAFIGDRWAGVAWLALRDSSVDQSLSSVSSSAMLGGPQAGLRIAHAFDSRHRSDAYVRLTTTGRQMDGVEAALGVSWQPARSVPARLAIERRQAVTGDDARSAFAAMVVGGVNNLALPDGWRVDGYGATGVVGLARRDAFVEGSLRATRPLGTVGGISLSAGGGVWGAAQPGVSRLDAGPTLDARWNGAAPRLSLDWRQRLAGQARPDSGIAITVSTDF